MKNLVVYFSLEGNTAYVAEKIKEKFIGNYDIGKGGESK